MSEEAKTEEQELDELAVLEQEILAAAEQGSVDEKPEPETELDIENDDQPKPEAEPKPEEDGDPEPEKKSEPAVDPEAKAEPEPEEKPDNSAYARLRHKAKELERQLAEARQKLQPETGTDKSAEKAVKELAKVWDTGEGDEKSLIATIRNASSKELHDIYQKANSGEYGDQSDDVIAMIQREMPMVQQREAVANEDAKARREAIKKAYDDELKMAKEDFSEFAKEDSEGAKFLSEFTDKVAGTLDPETGELKGGELPEELAMYLHSHPYVLHQLADKVFKQKTLNSEASSVEMAKLQKERDSYKNRLAKYEAVESPSSSAKTGDEATGDESLEDLEKQILSLAGG